MALGTPVPLSATSSAAPGDAIPMLSVAWRSPAANGLKATRTVHVVSAAMRPMQVRDTNEKSSAWSWAPLTGVTKGTASVKVTSPPVAVTTTSCWTVP